MYCSYVRKLVDRAVCDALVLLALRGGGSGVPWS